MYTNDPFVRDPRDDNMFPNPNCFKLRALAKEFTKTVADMTKDQCKSLAQKLKNYVQDVSLYSHPSANGILGKQSTFFTCGILTQK